MYTYLYLSTSNTAGSIAFVSCVGTLLCSSESRVPTHTGSHPNGRNSTGSNSDVVTLLVVSLPVLTLM